MFHDNICPVELFQELQGIGISAKALEKHGAKLGSDGRPQLTTYEGQKLLVQAAIPALIEKIRQIES